MKVLFVCKSNMVRSQMAETFYNQMTQTNNASSAGVEALLFDNPSPRAVNVMSELGLDMKGQHGKQLTDSAVEQADKVVVFPAPDLPDELMSNDKTEFWDVEDIGYGKPDTVPFDRQVRDEIKKRVELLIKRKHND